MKLKKRKWLSLLLCFALILSLMPTTALAANDVFSGGNGTQASPYEISDLSALEAFRDYVNAGGGWGEYFKLTADIDMSEKYGADIGGSEISWTPIGIGNISFIGNFDGGGHTVSGLYINAPNSDDQGLFGWVGSSGTVQNLGVDGTVSGDAHVGGVVGENHGTVTNCRNTGAVIGGRSVGGVVGNTYGAVTSCCNTGDVRGIQSVGGVVGDNDGTVTNCYNTGTVSSDIQGVGGVVGDNYGTMTNCYNTGTVSGSQNVGGVIGYNSLSGTATNCCYLTGTADGGIGGTVDSSESADKEGSAEARTAAEFAVQSTFVGWDFDGTWSMDKFYGRPVLPEVPEDDYISGSGTETDPYLISNLAMLEAFREYVNAGGGAGEYFKLTADIDMSENYGADISMSWTPIGNGNMPFSGNFDGGGHTVSGLFINAPSSAYQGLFGVVSEGGTVQDLGVDGSVIGYYYVGGVVGINNGTVTSCYNTGDVSGRENIGGVIGENFNGTVTSCYNTGDVSGSASVGGVVGYVGEGGTVTNCYNTGKVSGDEKVGGVVGDNEGTVTNCCNTGDVSGSKYVGGVAGENDGTVTNCYNTGDVSGSKYVGGVVGYNWSTVTNCYYLTNTANGGISGADVEGSAEAKTAAEFAVQNTFVDWDFDGTWLMDNFHGRPVLLEVPEDDYISGSGTETDPYLISNLAMLEAFRDYVNAGSGAGEYFKLTADIDMSEKYGADIGGSEISWTPIGNNAKPFKGNFDGGGHTVSGLFINAPSSYYQGLFGVVGEGGAVQDLGVDGSVIGDYYVGGVVGENEGTVTNCRNTGTVSGRENIGGVIGDNFNGTVTDCRNTGTVSGIASVGGVVGHNYGSTVTNCYNTGDVSGGSSVGGVIGENNGTVTSCRNTGTVRGNEDVGSSEYIGGVVGTNDDTVTNCYNTGDVSGSAYVGGVVGTNNDAVTNCYNTGKVSGGSSVGGVAGWSRGTETSCYYLTGTADGGIGGTADSSESADKEGSAEVKTAAEFATQSTFVGWDFGGTWSMDNIFGRPVLTAIAETDYFSGEGTAESPYLIPDLATLEIVRNYINAYNGAGEYFKLTADIDMSENYGADIGGSEISWTPIGNETQFKGNFDGGGHKISGLYINSTSDYQGLFGFVGEGGTVQDLGVDGSVIGDYYVGGVTGMNYGTVTSCFNTGDVGGDHYVGGVVGSNDGTVTNCYNMGDVNGGDEAGGVIGMNHGTVTSCRNTGDVSGDQYVGGVAGSNRGTVTNCYNTGDVSGNSSNVGGVTGVNYNTVTNCCNTGTVIGDYYVGGVTGLSNGTVKNCYNTGTVIGNRYIGGVVGLTDINDHTVTNCYYLTGTADGGIGGTADSRESADKEGSAEVKTAEQFACGEVAYLLQGDQTEQVWGQTVASAAESKDASPVLTGDIAKKIYKVTFAAAESSEYAVKYANSAGVSSMPDTPTGEVGFAFEKWTLGGAEFTAETPVTADITVTAQWLNHPTYTVTIPTQVSIGGTAEIKAENVNIAEGYLLNVTLSECDFILETAEGAQLKYTVTKDGKAVNVSDTVLTVEGGTADDSGTAKLAFNLADGETVTYAGTYTGTVTFTVSVKEDVLTQDQDGVYRIRGAKSLAAFRDLVNSGQTDINAMLMNDIDLKGSETNQWTPIGNSAKLFKGNFDGGGHTISGLYINSTSDYQGLFGVVDEGGTVQNLGVDGTVSGSDYVGGVVGYNNGRVTNCYNTGAASGSYYVGGVVGLNIATVTNCYNTGAVSGTGNRIGGVVGRSYSTVTNCYYLTGTADGGIEGADVAGSAEAKTAEEFATQSTFVDWDFEAIWQMSDTLKRPTLRSNPENAS